MMFFSERKKLAEQYEKWISENKDILDCPLTVISWLVGEGYLGKTKVADLEAKLAEKDEEIKQLKLDLGMFKSVNEFINGYGVEKAREVLLQTEKTKKQDKISFAVEQLEKVKELAHNHIKEIANDLSEENDERLNQKHTIHGLATAITDIDSQIKQLKEMK